MEVRHFRHSSRRTGDQEKLDFTGGTATGLLIQKCLAWRLEDKELGELGLKRKGGSMLHYGQTG